MVVPLMDNFRIHPSSKGLDRTQKDAHPSVIWAPMYALIFLCIGVGMPHHWKVPCELHMP
jgi:hypothetical protein